MYDDIFNDKDMEKLQEELKSQKKTITTAESCTGGLIASMITEISGSSEIFNGAIVTYSNEIKEQELKVNKNTIIQHGVVSIEVVQEMLIGVLEKFNADYAIAVSGIAGPNGGTNSKPVGTVAIGVMQSDRREKIKIYNFAGNRKEIQLQSAKIALKEILKFICKKP